MQRFPNPSAPRARSPDVLPIPTYIFKDRSVAVLEAIVSHFKERGLSTCEIARLLNRDQRTIATVTYRLAKKRQR